MWTRRGREIVTLHGWSSNSHQFTCKYSDGEIRILKEIRVLKEIRILREIRTFNGNLYDS